MSEKWVQPWLWQEEKEPCHTTSFCLRVGHCHRCRENHTWYKCDECIEFFKFRRDQ